MHDKERMAKYRRDKQNEEEALSESKSLTEENPFDHDDLTNRIRRTLYYDPLKRPDTDTLSFSATESAVSHIRHVAPMPVGKLGHRYASRVARDACISPCALILGLIYIERLKHKNPNYLENISSSDLFLVSMMVSSKYLFDEGCEDEVFNDEWALSGEMEVARVNKMEREFLKAIDWHLYVNPQEFSSMLNIAETDIALSNGRKRGWLTYSDLRSLLDSQKLYRQLTLTAGILSKATCMCMIMYSGFVCLAALTSTALITMSSKPLQNKTPFGVQPHNGNISVSELAENDTDSELKMMDFEPDSLALLESNGFSGFPVHHGPRRLGRQRIWVGEADDVQQSTENGIHDAWNDPLVPDEPNMKALSSVCENRMPDQSDEALSPNERSGKVAAQSFPFNTGSSKKSSICSILEAVFYVAHVPAIFCMDRAPDHCRNCGKPDPETETRYQTCGRYHAWERVALSNYSIGFHGNIQGVRIFPSKMSSMPGIYNPTMPPLLQMHRKRNDLRGRPVVVV